MLRDYFIADVFIARGIFNIFTLLNYTRKIRLFYTVKYFNKD